MIKAVVFDIGNVLLEWDPEKLFDPEIGPERRAVFFSEADVHTMNERVDLGHPFTETVEEWANKHPAWRDELQLWHDRWIDMAQPAIDHSVRLMAALQAKAIPVFSLTNFGVQTYERAAKQYPFMRDFDRDFISGHLGLIKPDPAIYQTLEEQSGLTGDALIFTDDRRDNIEAAAKRGWHTHLFEGPQGWADRLVAEGLLSVAEAQ